MWLVMNAVVLITTYSLVGLVAVWGALGGGHWFLRIAAVQLFLAFWLAAPDYSFWVAFFVQSAIVIVSLLSIRRLTGSRFSLNAAPQDAAVDQAPTFSLKDLFLLMLVLGGVLTVLARAWTTMQLQWLSAAAPGTAFAVITLMGVWAASTNRIWARLALLIVFFPGCMVAAWLWLARSARGRIGQVASIAGLLLIAAPPVAFYVWLVEPQFISLAAPPDENGMDDLLRAAEMVARPAIDVNALSGEPLRAYIAQNHRVLELARAALARPCQMTMPTDGTPLTDLNFERTQNLRQLGRVLAAAARNHLEAGDLHDAAEDYFQVVRLGDAMMHGGVMLHATIGVAIQGPGLEGLRQLLPQLDSAACQDLDSRLAKLDAEQEEFDEIAWREWQYAKKTTPWNVRWTLLQVPQLWDQSRQAAELAFRRGVAWRRLLRTHVALRRFWLAQGRRPETLEELVPRFLAALPLDPFSGRNFLYRRLADGYRLYSVGENGIDDGGEPARPATAANPAQGDLMLDDPL